jgi:hypothetical protein
MLSGFEVDRAVAMLLHLETRVRVLGDGLRRHALRREESFGTKPGGGAAIKGGAPRIMTISKKKPLFVPPRGCA